MHDLALVISDLGSGGAQRVLNTLAHEWLARGHRPCVITLSDAESDFFTLDPRITRLTIGGIAHSPTALHAAWANVRRIRRLRRALRQSRAETVVAFVGQTNILTILAAVGLGARVVVSERNDPARQSLGGRAWDALRRLSYRFADAVTANSHAAVEALGRFVPRDKLSYVPNPAPPLPPMPPADARAPIVLSVGRLTHQKGHDLLIDAFARAGRDLPDWRLCIVGDGELKQALQARAATRDIADRVTWAGRVDDPGAFYGQAGIFVLASRFEGTPNAVLEAMACGLPVIVTDRSAGALDFVTDGDNGIVVPGEDAAGLATALAGLMRDPERRRRLGRRARDRMARESNEAVFAAWARVFGLPAPAA